MTEDDTAGFKFLPDPWRRAMTADKVKAQEELTRLEKVEARMGSSLGQRDFVMGQQLRFLRALLKE
jgi:hypothetical protein